MIYHGQAFSSTFAKGKASGRINLEKHDLHFSNEEGSVSLPLSGIQVEVGGNNQSLVFFSHPEIDDWKIYTGQKEILRDPIFQNHPAISSQVQKIRKKSFLSKSIVTSALAFIVLICVGLWSLKNIAIDKAAEQIPVEWEVKLGETAYDAFSSGKNILKNEELHTQLNELLAPLVKATDDNRYPFEFHIIEDSTMNAAAFPGGHVIIHTGLIQKLDKPEQLLGVLAHEIAHVKQQHSVKSIIKHSGIYIIISSLFGDISGLGAVVISGGETLLQLENSREHENDADEKAWEYLIDAKIKPYGMVECFEIMSQQEQAHGEIQELTKDLDFLSTHPALSERIEKLTAKWKKLDPNDFPEQKFNYKAFQELIQQQLNNSTKEVENAE